VNNVPGERGVVCGVRSALRHQP